MNHIRRGSALERIKRALASSREQEYRTTAVERQDVRERWQAWLVGECGRGHSFEMSTDKWLRGQRCTECRREDHVHRWMEVAGYAQYRVNAEVRTSVDGWREVYFVGECPEGHHVDDIPARMFRGEGCPQCYSARAEREWFARAEAEGYLVVCVRIASGARGIPFLQGKCPKGHPVRIRASRFMSGARCRECIRLSSNNAHLVLARREGLNVALEFRSKGAVLVGTCHRGHPIAMRTSTFAAGGRCGDCRLDDIRREHLALALSEGYVVELELRSNGSQGVMWIIGQCPEGHRIQLPLTKFAAGERCREVGKSGFDPNKPAALYLIEGQGRLKFGISNGLTRRLASHEKNGFTEWIAFVHCDDGLVIQTVERRLKRALDDNAVQTCHAQGLRFDGSTESFLIRDFDIEQFDELLAYILEQFEAPTLCSWYAPHEGLLPATRALGMQPSVA